MPSSISSSDAAPLSRSTPAGPWAVPLLAGMAALLLFVLIMEGRLALRGYVPTLADSAELWTSERARASALGERALILVGGSRIQLGADLEVLRRETGLEPVQLAIDGSNFMPVLADLAADPGVRGTVIVDFSEHLLLGSDANDRAPAMLRAWRTEGAAPPWTFAGSEGRLARALHARLRSYADGAGPWLSLRTRLLRRDPVPQYLVTLPDRSRYADYARVPMPEFYFGRVMRHLGEYLTVPPRKTYVEVEAMLRRQIEAQPPWLDRSGDYLAGVMKMARLVADIRRRGGRVLVVRLPTSGLITLLDEQRFPRAAFWQEMARNVGAPTLHSADVPALREFHCPDGSHLDMRDRARFSSALVTALGLRAAN